MVRSGDKGMTAIQISRLCYAGGSIDRTFAVVKRGSFQGAMWVNGVVTESQFRDLVAPCFVGDAEKRLTMRRSFIMPDRFHCIPDEFGGAELKKAYPDGISVKTVNGIIVEVSGIDFEWAAGKS